MPRADLSSIDKILKEVYAQRVIDLLNNEARAFKLYSDCSEGAWTGQGRVYVHPARIGRNRAIKATGEGGYLPNPGRQSWDDWRVTTRYLHGAMGLTIQAIKHAQSDRGAFKNAFESESKGLVEDFSQVLNRVTWGDGRGILARVNGDIGGGGTVTIPVKDPGGALGAVNGGRFLAPGTPQVAFFAASPANNTPLAIRDIVGRAADGSTVTVDSNLTNATAPVDGIITLGVSRNSVLEGSWNLEPMGLLGIVDDGTYVDNINSIVRSAQPLAKANVFSGVGDIDEIIFHRALDMCDEMSGREPNKWLCSYGVHREVIKLSLEDKRYTGDHLYRPDPGIKGGGPKRELPFGGVGFIKERHCPYNTLFMVDDSVLHKLPLTGDGTPGGGEWIDEDGAVLKQIPGKDEFEAMFRVFVNFFAVRMNSHVVLRGINSVNDINNAL